MDAWVVKVMDAVLKQNSNPVRYFVVMYRDSRIVQSQEFDDFETALNEYRYMCGICELGKQTDSSDAVLSCELQQRNAILCERCF